MFRLELFPADQGDAILIEYGEPSALHRVLIDAGTPDTAERVRARLEQLREEERQLELLVVTHVDTDHIGGVLKLLDAGVPALGFDDVWFNALRHFGGKKVKKKPKKSSELGDVDGEILSRMLKSTRWPWNRAFRGKAVQVPAKGALPVKKLRGGMQLTVLSPGAEQIAKLRERWEETAREAGLDPDNPHYAEKLLEKARRKGISSSLLGEAELDVPGLAGSKFKSDRAIANGSTIALLAEYKDQGVRKSCLLAGDAFATVMADSITRLLKERGVPKLSTGAFKLAHHGSAGNVSNRLLELVDTRCYLFSTSGAVFGHPDDEAVGRVIATPTDGRKTLHFNYSVATISQNYLAKKKRAMRDWIAVAEQFNCAASFPDTDNAGVVIDL